MPKFKAKDRFMYDDSEYVVDAVDDKGYVATLLPKATKLTYQVRIYFDDEPEMHRITTMSKPWQSYPSRQFPWGVLALEGNDASMVMLHEQRWFRTKREASKHADQTLMNFVVARATIVK